MTDLRKAAEVALIAMEDLHEDYPISLSRPIELLRQALAQQDALDKLIQNSQEMGAYYVPEPVAWVGLHLNDMPEMYAGDRSFLHGAKWAEAKLKEKNT